ncbi:MULTISPECIES: DNA methyltransferase [unclassified Bartonella]|uniref:DNA methyltransferase n=1 Tax=unclassified Bartonella TaxID=2645622 RepID=UPI0035CF7042
MGEINQKKYFSKHLKSLGHTPIYKMHKYFARRPHNVFRELIDFYTKEGQIIFDPFGGGGVTLIEGLTLNRKIVSTDVNPVASFIQYCQICDVDAAKILSYALDLKKMVKGHFEDSFTTECGDCKNDKAHVRWIEHAYLIKCPHCSKNTSFRNDNKALNDAGKQKNGIYVCDHCSSNIKAADAPRISSEIISLRYRCKKCGAHDAKEPSRDDIEKHKQYSENLEKLKTSLGLHFPDFEIPAEWDRQQEDCLHRKGFVKFTDFFTPRNLLISASFFEMAKKLKIQKDMSDPEYDFLIFILSSLIRYTNNMNFSTSSWMDGRPVAWAKHAFWIPNQFIETNPFEYFDNRLKAIKSGLKDRDSRFNSKKNTLNFSDLEKGSADFMVQCVDSKQVDIPDGSVDMIITDPPYGSNVQYGELCAFWQVWLEGRTKFPFPEHKLASEAVVHRKTKDKTYQKDFSDYYELLLGVFQKCNRVLKSDGCLVYTFNNKDIRAWYAVIKATLDAGFHIEPEGIFYQEAIHAYRDTAHLRHDGTPQGDFIYTFSKKSLPNEKDYNGSFNECLNDTMLKLQEKDCSVSFGEFLVELYANSALCLIRQIKDGANIEDIENEFNSMSLEKAYARIDLRTNQETEGLADVAAC